jgi:hypothetical protein
MHNTKPCQNTLLLCKNQGARLAGNSPALLAGKASPVWVVREACPGLADWQLQLIKHAHLQSNIKLRPALQKTLLHGLQETASPVWVVGEACAGLVEWQLQLIKHQEGV